MYVKISTQEEINTFAKETFQELLKQSTKSILQELKQNTSSAKKEFLQAVDSVLTLGYQMQQRKEKEAITFLYIFYLKSSLLTGTYEFQINLFDKRFYFDKQECYGFWIPRLFVKYFEEDLTNFYEKARKHLIQFGYAAKQDVKLRYYDAYLAMIGQFIIKEGPELAKLSSFQKLEKEEDIRILFGGYMDRGIRVYPPLSVEVV